MSETFTAQVKRWADNTAAENEAIFKASVSDTVEDAQKPRAKGGRMRVDTGNLRNDSFSAGAGGVELAAGNGEAYVLALARMELGEAFFAEWGAEYARPREFGARGQPGDFFVRGAAQKWQQFVTANEARLRA